MAPQSNPDSLTNSAANALLDAPSQDDLLALVPDMELLESSTIDAFSAQSAAAAAAGSARRRSPTPKLTDQNAATTVRSVAANTTIHDDPYADLMPELEALEDTTAFTRTIPQMSASVAATATAKPPIPAPPPSAARAKSAPIVSAAPPTKRPPATASRPAAPPAGKAPTSTAVRAPVPASAKNLPN